MKSYPAPTAPVFIEGIQINVPTGDMTPPRDDIKKIMDRNSDERGWKWPVKPFVTSDKQLAEEYARCLDYYHGGHEEGEKWTRDGHLYIISSKGYYVYCGGCRD